MEDARRSALAGVQAYARAALDQRLRTLTDLASRVNDAEHVSADLLGDYRAARSGLESLNDRIPLSTSVEEALRLTEKMASDYRVYVVLVPKTAEVVIGDSFVVASGQIDEAIDGVLDVVDALEQFGRHPVRTFGPPWTTPGSMQMPLLTSLTGFPDLSSVWRPSSGRALREHFSTTDGPTSRAAGAKSGCPSDASTMPFSSSATLRQTDVELSYLHRLSARTPMDRIPTGR